MADLDKIASKHEEKFWKKLNDLDEVRTRRIHVGDAFDYILKKYEAEVGPAAGPYSRVNAMDDESKKAYRLGYINALNDLSKAIFICNDVQRSKIIDLMMWEAKQHDADLGDEE